MFMTPSSTHDRWSNRSKTSRQNSLICLIVLALLTTSCESRIDESTSYEESKSAVPPLELPGVRCMTNDDYLYEYPNWSPDGKTIAVMRNTSGLGSISAHGPITQRWDIVLLDTINGESRVVGLANNSPSSELFPSWSENGLQLAFLTQSTETNNLVIYSVDSNTWQQIECSTCSWPRWLDKESILINLNFGLGLDNKAQFGLARVDTQDGTKSKILITDLNGPYAISSNREFVLMVDFECTSIWAYKIDSGKPIPIIDSPDIHECDPAWSSDGSKLAYTVKDPPSVAPTYLVIADADGSSYEILLKPELAIYQIRHPTWSPDGTKIAFVYGYFSSIDRSFSSLYVVDIPPHLRPKASQTDD